MYPLFFSPGFLVSIDPYMNLYLNATEEWSNGKMQAELGQTLIRCNNVLYVTGAEGQ